MDPLLRTVLTLALLALVVWVIVSFLPMPAPFGTIIVTVAAIGCILYAFRAIC